MACLIWNSPCEGQNVGGSHIPVPPVEQAQKEDLAGCRSWLAVFALVAFALLFKDKPNAH
jgi:hypothetical protein